MIDINEKLKKSNLSNEIFDLIGLGKKNSYQNIGRRASTF